MFEVAAPAGSPPRCPAGFSAANHPSLIYSAQDPVTYANYHMECLKVRGGRTPQWRVTALGCHLACNDSIHAARVARHGGHLSPPAPASACCQPSLQTPSNALPDARCTHRSSLGWRRQRRSLRPGAWLPSRGRPQSLRNRCGGRGGKGGEQPPLVFVCRFTPSAACKHSHQRSAHACASRLRRQPA